MASAASQLVPPFAWTLDTASLSAPASVLQSTEPFTLEEKSTRETSTASGVSWVLLAVSWSMRAFVADFATARRVVRFSVRV